MKQTRFEQAYHADWLKLEQALDLLERRKPVAAETLGLLPDLYRSLVRQHALAVDRYYSAGLIAYLQNLVQRTHAQLYRSPELLLTRILGFISRGFPRAVRRHARHFWLAFALFYVPALSMGVWCYVQPDAVYSVMDAQQVAEFEYMYDPANTHPGRGETRQADTDLEMFGYYIMNNTGIGFRSFASGLLFGVGSAYITVFNGLMIGAVAGHLSGMGYGGVFWPFAVTHGAFELTAICISAAGGLMLGGALLFPGPLRRRHALRIAAAEAVPLVTGAAMFFFIAAAIEGFWSPSAAPAPAKYLVAALMWTLVALYLTLAGRSSDAA